MTSVFSRIKNAFNNMAEPPKRHYTLGEAYKHYVLKKPWGQTNSNRLNFTKAGRATERTMTAMGVIMAAAFAVTNPLIVALPMAALSIAFFKAGGLALGKFSDFDVRSREAEDGSGNDRQPRKPRNFDL